MTIRSSCKNKAHLTAVLLSGLALFSASAAEARDNKYVWKMTTLNQTYHINFNNPADCDANTIDGATIWNPASRFKANYGPMFSGNIVRNTAGVQISFEPAANMVNGAGTPAEAPPGSSSGTVVIDSKTLTKVSDADIRINADHWVQGYMRCGETTPPATASQFDFGRFIAHEMGHVVGVDDVSVNVNCLTYYQMQYQIPLTAPCSTEAAFAVRLNGAP